MNASKQEGMIANLLLADITKMEIIKLFQINIFMPGTKFPCLTILLFAKGGPLGSLISSGDFSKKLMAKNGDFVLRKKGRKKHGWLK